MKLNLIKNGIKRLAQVGLLFAASNYAHAANDITTLGDRVVGIIVYVVGFTLLAFFAMGIMRVGGVFNGLKRLKGNSAQQQDPSAAKDLGIEFASGLGLMGLTILISYLVVSFFGTTAIINAASFNGIGGGEVNMIDLGVGQK